MAFDDSLGAIGELRFSAEATRARNEQLVLLRSRYRQPFGRYHGSLPGPEPIVVADGFGVAEDHDVYW